MQITIDNLGFERNNTLLFSHICCELQPGDLLQVRGANGSGKSTLLRILAGYLEPHEGVIRWQKEGDQPQLCFIGHQNGLKSHLTVFENLALSCLLMGSKLASPCLEKKLARVGLQPIMHRPASQLSAGQARRLALARLMIGTATVWILDEPTTALDEAGRQVLMDLIDQHRAQRGIVIVATHHDLPWTHTTKLIRLPS